MLEGKVFLAIIPARGGSKRLPGKNIRPLAGKPLIHWTIEAARASRWLDDIVVSTDDPDIARVVEAAGVPVPFLRPAELATDEAPTEPVLRHALAQWEARTGKRADYVVVLQPTSPLRTAEHIDRAIERAVERAADGVATVCPVEHPVEWINTLPEDDSLSGFLAPEVVGRRSQTLPQRYRLNGAVGIMRAQAVRAGTGFWSLPRLFACRMPLEASIDIDTEWDFMLAECLMQRRIQQAGT